MRKKIVEVSLTLHVTGRGGSKAAGRHLVTLPLSRGDRTRVMRLFDLLVADVAACSPAVPSPARKARRTRRRTRASGQQD